MQDKRIEGEERCRKREMTERRDAGKERSGNERSLK